MARVIINAVLLAALTVASTAAPLMGAPSARVMYGAALAREQAVRTAESRGRKPTVSQIRAVITAYEAVVRRHPASGYSDNALWQAAGLAADAFKWFGDDKQRRTAIRLLSVLRERYPTSSLVSKAGNQLGHLKSAPVADSSRLEQGGPTPAAAGSTGTGFVTPAEAGIVKPVAALATRSAAGYRPPSPTVPVVIRSIRRVMLPEVVRVTLELDREVPYQEQRLWNPARMFLDLKGTQPAPALIDASLNFDGELVRQIRIGRHPNNTTRVVVDLQGVTRYSVFPLYNPYRLVIDCERPRPLIAERQNIEKAPIGGSRPAPVPMLPPPAGITGADGSTLGLQPSPEASEASREAIPTTTLRDEAIVVPAPEPPIPAATTSVAALPAPSAPSANLRGGFSVARQLGLGISRIVIDAGHGGHDPGAQGGSLSESELVLDVSLRLEKLLRKQPGVEVILTRRSNVYVPLEERTAIANRESADLFLSIHANASRNDRARGVETYFLNFASNPDAAAVAARENSASGRTMHNLPEILRAIALTNKLDESRDFATLIQQSMVERLKGHNKQLRDLGVRQAPFMVLIGAAMPSVLAEISFLTNAHESRLLRGGAYRQRIAEALLDGISKYQRSLKRVGTIAEGGRSPRQY